MQIQNIPLLGHHSTPQAIWGPGRNGHKASGKPGFGKTEKASWTRQSREGPAFPGATPSYHQFPGAVMAGATARSLRGLAGWDGGQRE